MKRRMALFVSCCVATSVLLVALCGCSGGYTPIEKSAKITPPIIKEDSMLRVGVNAGNPPFAAESSGKIIGFDADMAAALADQLGLKLQLVDVGSDPEGALSRNEVDIVAGLDDSDSELTCWKSEAYLKTASALFAPLDTDVPPTKDMKDLKIAAQTSSRSAWEIGNQFGNPALLPCPDLIKTCEAAQNNEAQYAAIDALTGAYIIKAKDYSLHMVALMKKPHGNCIGVAQTNVDLQKAIAEAISQVKASGINQAIEMKWFGSVIDLKSMPVVEPFNNATNKETKKALNTTNESSQDENNANENSSEVEKEVQQNTEEQQDASSN